MVADDLTQQLSRRIVALTGTVPAGNPQVLFPENGRHVLGNCPEGTSVQGRGEHPVLPRAGAKVLVAIVYSWWLPNNLSIKWLSNTSGVFK